LTYFSVQYLSFYASDSPYNKYKAKGPFAPKGDAMALAQRSETISAMFGRREICPQNNKCVSYKAIQRPQ